MDDINSYKSHSDKSLIKHTQGVIQNLVEITDSPLAKIAAIFHDVGKLNPNFQKKFDNTIPKTGNYSNHSTISAYAFWCFINQNYQKFSDQFNLRLSKNDVLSILVLIAKHHGNLPDFIPGKNKSSDYIFDEKDFKDALTLISKTKLPIYEFVSKFGEFSYFSGLLILEKSKEGFLKYGFMKGLNVNALDFYLDTKSNFSSLLYADKKDAGCIELNDKDAIHQFCNKYNGLIANYVDSLKPYQNIPINKLRTKIRNEAVSKIETELKTDNRVFDLTAPTGSGKTLMLLSLAGKIIKKKGGFRVIYAIPFLSITEQVEKEAQKIFKGFEDYIHRIDSKSESNEFENLQKDLDSEPDDEKIRKLLSLQFSENTFSYPFVITTFVRFFETLLSNKNSSLLKLPNFSKSIFLIDEIQSLPPRLYGFLVAFLNAFCKKYDSYAIVSTATMPDFKLPDIAAIKKFFPKYFKPVKLLSSSYFSEDEFNRYHINIKNNAYSINELANDIKKETKSVLIILNTISDSKELFKELSSTYTDDELFLLNTHFTPNDRKLKIKTIKGRLNKNKPTILVSTQLIEAGVDIDFPILYRDMAVMSSIVQSAGRCNRNGKLKSGKVRIIRLIQNGKERSNLIYRGKDKKLLSFTKEQISKNGYTESELFAQQKNYFMRINKELLFGLHSQNSPKVDLNLTEDISDASFEKVGKFRLIDQGFYGEVYNFYIPESDHDDNFNILLDLHQKQKEAFKESLEKGLARKSIVKEQLKKMSGQIVQVRINPSKKSIPSYFNKIYDLYLIDRTNYSLKQGLSLPEIYEII